MDTRRDRITQTMAAASNSLCRLSFHTTVWRGFTCRAQDFPTSNCLGVHCTLPPRGANHVAPRFPYALDVRVRVGVPDRLGFSLTDSVSSAIPSNNCSEIS